MEIITTTNMDTAHKSPWEISEVIFGIPFLISIAIHLIVPISLLRGIIRQSLIAVGITFIIIGIIFIVLAHREFTKFGQSMEPGQVISKIIDTGVFSVSRNPLYLGIVIVFIGIALVLDVFWILIFLIPEIILCQYILIAPEERYLQNKFGKEYLVYATSVRRWFGRK